MKFTQSATFWLTIIGIGLAIIAFSMPVATSLSAEARKEDGYLFALRQEISYNSRSAENVVDQYKKHEKIEPLPTYTNSAYEAILNAGLFNVFEPGTPSRLMSLYSHVSLWPATLETARSQNNQPEQDRIIGLHAKLVTIYTEDVMKDYDFNQNTQYQASIYQFVAMAGVFIVGISVLGSVVSLFILPSISGRQRTRKK